MNVSHLVTRPMITIAPDNNILTAAKMMVQNNVGLLVVTSKEKQELIGVVSERDIIGVIAKNRALETPVADICTKRVVTVHASSDVADVAKAMNQHAIRHVVVVDDANAPTGVVSMRDLVGERATLTSILQSNEKEVFHGAD